MRGPQHAILLPSTAVGQARKALSRPRATGKDDLTKLSHLSGWAAALRIEGRRINHHPRLPCESSSSLQILSNFLPALAPSSPSSSVSPQFYGLSIPDGVFPAPRNAAPSVPDVLRIPQPRPCSRRGSDILRPGARRRTHPEKLAPASPPPSPSGRVWGGLGCFAAFFLTFS